MGAFAAPLLKAVAFAECFGLQITYLVLHVSGAYAT